MVKRSLATSRMPDTVAFLNTDPATAFTIARLFVRGRFRGWQKGTLKILQELLNHEGLVGESREQGLPTLLQSALQVQPLRFESSATTVPLNHVSVGNIY